MSNILFCGSYIPNTISENIRHCSQAANNFQGSIINRLSVNNNVDILTYVSYYEENVVGLTNALKQKNIYYIIKQQFKKNYLGIYKKYYKLFNELIRDKDAVILYNYSYINFLVNYFCSKNNVKIILIVADHTECSEHTNPVRKLLAYKYSTDFLKFDNLIFLSEFLRSKYDKYRPNTVLLEGGIETNKYKSFTPKDVNNKLIILFSGVLTQVTGVDIFLKAIELIENKDIQFVFTGKGELEDMLIDYSKRDQRVKYVGFLEENDYFNQLYEAHILINPRNMNLMQNRNNFPSKILEYLATGKVIISTKFPGYQKFEDNVIFSETNPENLAETILSAAKRYNDEYRNQFEKNRLKALEYDWNSQIIKIQQVL